MRCSTEYSSIEACPFDSTNRSRSHQPGFPGLNLSTSRQSTSATSASPMGAPGWPELAFWTASIERARMALASSRRVGMEQLLAKARAGILPDALSASNKSRPTSRCSRGTRSHNCSLVMYCAMRCCHDPVHRRAWALFATISKMQILQITDPHLYGNAAGELRGVETATSLQQRARRGIRTSP